MHIFIIKVNATAVGRSFIVVGDVMLMLIISTTVFMSPMTLAVKCRKKGLNVL